MSRKREQARTARGGAKSRPLPLVSSDQVLGALRRLGFRDGPAKGSSHLSMYRDRPDGGKDVTTVVLARNPIPRGTLDGILKVGRVTRDEFVRALGRKH